MEDQDLHPHHAGGIIFDAIKAFNTAAERAFYDQPTKDEL